MARKKIPDYDEGSQAATRFKDAIKRILTVPRSELERREEEYKKQTALKPKRGPKRKA